MSGSGDRVERIHAELAALDARLAELRALSERVERFELEPGDRQLLMQLVCECIAEKLAEEGESAGEEASGEIYAEGPTSEWEAARGPFGVFAWWMRPR